MELRNVLLGTSHASRTFAKGSVFGSIKRERNTERNKYKKKEYNVTIGPMYVIFCSIMKALINLLKVGLNTRTLRISNFFRK